MNQLLKEHVVSLYIILVLLIILIVNINIRNNRIETLEQEVNNLSLDKEYILEGINIQIRESEVKEN